MVYEGLGKFRHWGRSLPARLDRKLEILQPRLLLQRRKEVSLPFNEPGMYNPTPSRPGEQAGFVSFAHGHLLSQTESLISRRLNEVKTWFLGSLFYAVTSELHETSGCVETMTSDWRPRTNSLTVEGKLRICCRLAVTCEALSKPTPC